MKPNNPLETIDHKSGMTVPEGFFEEFADRMAASLPEQPWEKAATDPDSDDRSEYILPRSWWQRVRPYVYMAAMFAGIWLMMNMFSLMPGAQQASTGAITAQTEAAVVPLEPSADLAQAIQNDNFMSDYISDYHDADLYDALYEDGFNPSTASWDEI